MIRYLFHSHLRSLPIKNLINFKFQLNLILNLKVEDNVVLKKWLNSNVKQFFVITFISVILTLILFLTHIYDYIVNGTVFSGAGRWIPSNDAISNVFV